MVAFILVCLVLLLGLLWGWEIRKRKSLEQEFVKKKNEVCSVKEFSDTKIIYASTLYNMVSDFFFHQTHPIFLLNELLFPTFPLSYLPSP